MTEGPIQPVVAPVAIKNSAPGIAAASAPPTIVYNSAQADVRDYNSYKSLLDACATLREVVPGKGMAGSRVLGIQSDIATGLAYDHGPHCTWMWSGSDNSSFNFTITGGTSFVTPPVAITDMGVISAQVAAPFTIDLAGGVYYLLLTDATLTGTNGVIHFSDSVGGGSFQIICRGDSTIGQGAIHLDTGVVGAIDLFDISTLNPFTSGDAGSVEVDIYSSAVTVVDFTDPTCSFIPGYLQTPSIVFQPGSSSSDPNIINNEFDLVNTTLRLVGPYTVIVDCSLVGGTYDFQTVGDLTFAPGGTWTDLNKGYTIQFTAETVLPVVVNFAGSLAVVVNQTADLFPIAASTIASMGEASTVQSNGIGAVYSVEDGVTFQLLMHDYATLLGGGSQTVKVANTGIIDVDLFDRTRIGASTFAVTGGGQVFALASSPGVQITPDNYIYVRVVGLFLDQVGNDTAPTLLDPGTSGGQLLYSAGQLYVSDSANWLPLDASTVVYQPGGTASPGVFTDFAKLAAVVELNSGLTTIELDGTFSSNDFNIDGSQSLCASVRFLGFPDGSMGDPQLIFGATTDAILTGVKNLYFENCSVNLSNASQPLLSVTPDEGVSIYFDGTGSVTPNLAINANAQPIIIANVTTLSIVVKGSVALGFAGSALFDLSDDLSTASITLYDASVLQTGAVTYPSGTLTVWLKSADVIVDVQYALAINQGVTPPIFTDANTLNPNGIYSANPDTQFLGSDGSTWAVVGIVPYWARTTQSGRITLVAGVSPVIPAIITAQSRIIATYAAPNGSTGLGVLTALDVDRVIGAPGSFKVTSLTPTLATQVLDASDVDWVIIDTGK